MSAPDVRKQARPAPRWLRCEKERARVGSLVVPEGFARRLWGLMAGASLLREEVRAAIDAVADGDSGVLDEEDEEHDQELVGVWKLRELIARTPCGFEDAPPRHGDLLVVTGLGEDLLAVTGPGEDLLAVTGPGEDHDQEVNAALVGVYVYVASRDATGASGQGWTPIWCNGDDHRPFDTVCFGCDIYERRSTHAPGSGCRFEIPGTVCRKVEDPVGFYAEAARHPLLVNRLVAVCFDEAHARRLAIAAGGRKVKKRTAVFIAWLPTRGLLVIYPNDFEVQRLRGAELVRGVVRGQGDGACVALSHHTPRALLGNPGDFDSWSEDWEGTWPGGSDLADRSGVEEEDLTAA